MVIKNDRILDAAAEILAKRPDATLQTIANAAGISRTTIFNRYPTREDLIQALAIDALQRIGQVMHRIPSGDNANFESVLIDITRGFMPLGPRTTFLRLIPSQANDLDAQWEDVGPFETDDWGYVFGRNPQPKTVMNNGVGLDVSPAVRDYLGLVSGVRCDWRFCEVSEVPDGPWRKFGENNPFVTMKDRQWAERITRLGELERERAAWLKQSRTTVMGPEPLDGRGG